MSVLAGYSQNNMQPIYPITRLGVVIIFLWYLGNTVYSDWDLTLDLSVSRFYRAYSVLPCQFAFKSERVYSFSTEMIVKALSSTELPLY